MLPRVDLNLCSKKFINSLRDKLSALGEKDFIARHVEQRGIRRDTLSGKSRLSRLFQQAGKVTDGRFVANGAICFAPDKSKIRNIVCFPGRVGAFQDRLRKYMVKLQAMLRS